jgi:branched-chain amino acid transport system ATP-binding protein
MSAVLQLDKLSVGYGDRAVVQDISCSLDYAESLLVIGHNGSGKTTLLRTLFGLHPKLGGCAKLLEEEVVPNSNTKLIRAGVRFLGQGLRYFEGLTVAEHRRVLCQLYGFEPAEDMNQTSRYELTKRVGRLSVGQRRMEALLMLAAGKPRLFLLDEPTAGIDMEKGLEILAWLDETRQRGVSFVVVEHNFERMLEICNKTMVIRAGEVTYFGQSAALQDEDTLSKYFL